MKHAWERMKEQTDKVGQEHSEVARGLADQASRLSGHAEHHKATRKQVHFIHLSNFDHLSYCSSKLFSMGE